MLTYALTIQPDSGVVIHCTEMKDGRAVRRQLRDRKVATVQNGTTGGVQIIELRLPRTWDNNTAPLLNRSGVCMMTGLELKVPIPIQGEFVVVSHGMLSHHQAVRVVNTVKESGGNVVV